MRPVSTTEILARKALRRHCGRECVEWAIGMLERGFESRSLLMLAGLSAPLNHFEVAELRDRALSEIGPPELAIEDPITAFVTEMVETGLAGKEPLRYAFAVITQLAIELGYPRELQVFYNLHFAGEDLQRSDEQWYWDGATRENIDHIMREEAERFLADARNGGGSP